MTFTNDGANYVALNIGSQVSNNYIQYCEVGYGSGTALVTNHTLVAGSIRNGLTTSPDFSTSQKVIFTSDFSSVSMSGLQFTEFGLFSVSGLSTGSTWQRQAFSPVTFDGTNELQISSAIEVIPG